jgi:hypothetical protein
MIISDIDYLESVLETSTTHLIGGLGSSALAIADFFALASGPLTSTNADVKTKAVTLPIANSSFASSSIQVTSSSPTINGVASASATATASISPTIKPI